MTTTDQYEIGLLSLHLPTGATTIHGFSPSHEGDGPHLASPVFTSRPIRDGGRLTLFEGLDPLEFDPQPGPIIDLRLVEPRFDRHGFNWAHRSTSDAAAAAQRHGFENITRQRAGQVLTELGYQLHPRRTGQGTTYHHDVLWRDQLDNLTWHVRETVDRRRDDVNVQVFVLRHAAR